jgi:hypothetical protein
LLKMIKSYFETDESADEQQLLRLDSQRDPARRFPQDAWRSIVANGAVLFRLGKLRRA